MKTAEQMLLPIMRLAGEKETGNGNNTTINKYWNAIGSAYCGFTIWYADQNSGSPYILDGCSNPAYCRTFGEWLTAKGYRLTDNTKAQKGDIAFYCEYNSSETRWMYQHVFFIFEKISGTQFITLEGNTMCYDTVEKARVSSVGTGEYEGIGYKKRNMPTSGTWAIFHPPYGKESTEVKKMAKRVYLSPSDQKSNTYAYGNTTEAIQCGKIAEACKAALERSGVEVMVGQYDTMANRCSASDKFGANLHVPIHTNACNGNVGGTRMFCYNLTGDGYKACQEIFKLLAPITPGTSENIKVNASLFEVKTPSAPTAYIEVDFHDVPSIAQWIVDNTELIGETIAEGICNYLGVKFKEKAKPATPSSKIYRVQVGAFSVKANADAMLQKLKNAGFDGFIV